MEHSNFWICVCLALTSGTYTWLRKEARAFFLILHYFSVWLLEDSLHLLYRVIVKERKLSLRCWKTHQIFKELANNFSETIIKKTYLTAFTIRSTATNRGCFLDPHPLFQILRSVRLTSYSPKFRSFEALLSPYSQICKPSPTSFWYRDYRSI